MPSSRREWLRQLLLTPLLLTFRGRPVRAESTRGVAERKDFEAAIAALVDTLVPDDETPGAIALGIDVEVLENIRAQEVYLEVAEEAIAWLDDQALNAHGVPFAALDEVARVALLQRAERSPRRSAQRQLFDNLADEVLRRYYANPAAWLQLGFAGPPQPAGFMAYREAPRDEHG